MKKPDTKDHILCGPVYMKVSREAAWPGDVSRSGLLCGFIGLTYGFAKTLDAKGEKCFGSEGMCVSCVCMCTGFLALCGRGSKDCNSREHISPLSWSSVAFLRRASKEGRKSRGNC